MTQVLLDHFKIQTAVKSDKSDTIYIVTRDRGKYSCNCRHWKEYGQYHDSHCRHILQEQLKELKLQVDFELMNEKFKSQAFFKSFEDALEYAKWSDNPQVQYFCTLILSIASGKSNTVFADDLHDLTDDKYAGNNNIGVAFGTLSRKGMIEMIRWERSNRPINHSKWYRRWQITDKGREALIGLT